MDLTDGYKVLKRQLVHSAVNKHNVVAKLGFDKFAEVKGGLIWLKRLAEDYSEDFLKRNSVPLTPHLWQELWKKAEWIDGELRDKTLECEYELEPEDIKQEAARTRDVGVGTDDSPATLSDRDSCALAIDESDNTFSATAAAAAADSPGRLPQQDSELGRSGIPCGFCAERYTEQQCRPEAEAAIDAEEA